MKMPVRSSVTGWNVKVGEETNDTAVMLESKSIGRKQAVHVALVPLSWKVNKQPLVDATMIVAMPFCVYTAGDETNGPSPGPEQRPQFGDAGGVAAVAGVGGTQRVVLHLTFKLESVANNVPPSLPTYTEPSRVIAGDAEMADGLAGSTCSALKVVGMLSTDPVG